MSNLFNINFTYVVGRDGTYSINIEESSKLAGGTLYYYIRGKGVPKELALTSGDSNIILLGQYDTLDMYGQVSGDIDVCKISVKKMDSHAPAYIYVSGPQLKLDNGSNLPTNECAHEWKHYLGIFDSYNYCVKCDKKISCNF